MIRKEKNDATHQTTQWSVRRSPAVQPGCRGAVGLDDGDRLRCDRRFGLGVHGLEVDCKSDSAGGGAGLKESLLRGAYRGDGVAGIENAIIVRVHIHRDQAAGLGRSRHDRKGERMTTLLAGVRYAAMFHARRGSGEGVFVPFFMLGDPDLRTSARLLRVRLQSEVDEYRPLNSRCDCIKRRGRSCGLRGSLADGQDRLPHEGDYFFIGRKCVRRILRARQGRQLAEDGKPGGQE